PAQSRFVVSIVVRNEGLPDPLGREVVIVPKDDRDPPLHIVRLDPAAEIDATREARGESLLVVEALIPARPGEPIDGGYRERVLELLGRALPFFDRHLVVVDSPHDGRPLWHYENDGAGSTLKKIDRIRLHGASASAEPMSAQWAVGGPSYLSLAGEPVRGPIGRAMLVGSSVLPALGQEGDLLAAWSAVRVITRTDGQKERIRRSMWSKVELG
ncbi:MAG: phytoene dehydrogenase, partial [Polyangiaceae bacterium]